MKPGRKPKAGNSPCNERVKKRPRGKAFAKGHNYHPPKADRWSENSEEAFYNWLEDMEPHILSRSGRWAPFSPTDEQKELIKAVFTKDEQGRLKHQVCLSIMPRRHGKSTVWALVVLFFHMARDNFSACLLGNNDQHVLRTMFKRLVDIISHSPKIRARIDMERDVLIDRIRDEKKGNVIFRTWVSMSGAFGDRINLLWVSDFHACPDTDPFNALQASLLDSEDSIILIDSNADHTGGHVHGLEQQAAEDDSIWCKHVQYDSFTEFCVYAPEWIDRRGAERLQKTALEADFRRDILGKRNSATNSLFPKDIVERCKLHYQVPVADIKELTKGRAYRVGGGLDRAKSLIHGPGKDFTVWSCVLKVANPDGEPEFYLLNQVKFLVNTSKAIKAAILEDHRRYHIDQMILENYETADLLGWAGEMGIPTELMTASDTAQNSSFPEMYRIFRDNRFHFPHMAKDFESELLTFCYTQRSNSSNYSFGHSSQKYHDDTVYSVNWAIFSLRKEILSPYVLRCVNCYNRNAGKRSLCILMGGQYSLMCSMECEAYQEVVSMFRNFKQFADIDSELTIEAFIRGYVNSSGAVRCWQEL